MDNKLIKIVESILASPEDGSPLSFQRDAAGQPTGLTDGKGRVWPLVDGVVDFVGSDNYASNFGDQWSKFPKLQLDSFNGSTISHDRFWGATQISPTDLEGKVVLDVGCGTGRFAEIALEAGAYVIALDYSKAAQVAAANLRRHARFFCVQANVYHLPFRPNSFDLVYCLGVLQHTPDVEKAFKSLVPVAKPGGRICVDYYWRRLRSVLTWKYAIRMVTSRMDEGRVYRALVHVHPALYAVSDLVARTPIIGKYLARFVPVVNYRNDHPEIGDEMLRAWSLLDTYDNWAPKYDQPQTSSTVARWAKEAGLINIETEHVGHLVLRAHKRA
jgi:SAM-dependent methyltransferase